MLPDEELGLLEGQKSPQQLSAAHGHEARVSVIVPSYNHSPFVKTTLRSIFKQTLAPAELLVIDDGSADATGETTAAATAAASTIAMWVEIRVVMCFLLRSVVGRIAQPCAQVLPGQVIV